MVQVLFSYFNNLILINNNYCIKNMISIIAKDYVIIYRLLCYY